MSTKNMVIMFLILLMAMGIAVGQYLKRTEKPQKQNIDQYSVKKSTYSCDSSYPPWGYIPTAKYCFEAEDKSGNILSFERTIEVQFIEGKQHVVYPMDESFLRLGEQDVICRYDEIPVDWPFHGDRDGLYYIITLNEKGHPDSRIGRIGWFWICN